MVDHPRAIRLAKRIGQIIAHALEGEVKDPRFELVTITDTRLTGDLRNATLYYTVLSSELFQTPDYKAVQEAFDLNKGKLRSIVGSALDIKHTPSLTFIRDTLASSVAAFDELLIRTKDRDAQIAQTATQARPAGEADPYKVGRL